ncbi:MAG: hypothetical protein ACE5G5_14435, partial [Candidatus Methylomirabilales bacterium]
MRALLSGLFVIFVLLGEAEGAFLQVKGAFHVHTSFSTGALSLEEVVEEARMEGIDSVIFSENFVLRYEYGLFPFRGLVKKVVEEPSVRRRGVGRWLESIEAAQARFPDVILIPGVEVVPYYYWTGSLFRGDLTMWDAQKNVLAVGLDQAEDYLEIPAIGNGRVLSVRLPHLLKSVLGLGLVGLGVLLVRKEREQKIRLKRFLVKVRKRHRVPGWLALGFGALFLVEGFTGSGLDPYRGDLGIKPYQRVIDSVEANGGMAFWSFPEARDFRKTAFGPLGTVTIQTTPHPEVLLESHGYTGFGALYPDNVTFTDPGGEWDQLLLEYTQGQRQHPAWGIGELGYHGPPKRLGEALTVFLVSQRSREAILEALKLGRFYGVKPKPDYRLVLEDFSIGQYGGKELIPMGGELAAEGKGPLSIRLRIGTSDRREVPFALRLIRSGRLLRVIEGRTPFSDTLGVAPPHRGMREFFRIELVKPHRLLSNPIFVRR